MIRATLIALAALTLLAGAARGQAAPATPAVLTQTGLRRREQLRGDDGTPRFGRRSRTFVAPDAIFFGEKSVMRGKQAVVDGWRPLFAGPAARSPGGRSRSRSSPPGTLAHSSGPVLDPSGRQIGTFNSVWRREADGDLAGRLRQGMPGLQLRAGALISRRPAAEATFRP